MGDVVTLAGGGLIHRKRLLALNLESMAKNVKENVKLINVANL